jgi:hypothetical protein
VTPQAIQQGLAQISGVNAVQGVSGQIAFDATGNAVDNAVVILYFDAEGAYSYGAKGTRDIPG